MPVADDITLRDYRALAELRYVIRRFLTFSEAAARAAEVEPQQHQLMLAIKGLPAGSRPTIGVLADRLQVHHNSAVELSRRAVENGLVVRKKSPLDGREVLLDITPRGERALLRLTLAHKEELRRAGPLLSRAVHTIVGAGPRTTTRKKG